jgi:hypothetical protein
MLHLAGRLRSPTGPSAPIRAERVGHRASPPSAGSGFAPGLLQLRGALLRITRRCLTAAHWLSGVEDSSQVRIPRTVCPPNPCMALCAISSARAGRQITWMRVVRALGVMSGATGVLRIRAPADRASPIFTGWKGPLRTRFLP